jgi:hypothetical protein
LIFSELDQKLTNKQRSILSATSRKSGIISWPLHALILLTDIAEKGEVSVYLVVGRYSTVNWEISTLTVVPKVLGMTNLLARFEKPKRSK